MQWLISGMKLQCDHYNEAVAHGTYRGPIVLYFESKTT